MSEGKKRKPNFTTQEKAALVEGVESRKEVIFSSFNNVDTNHNKSRAWMRISDEVSAVSGISRSVEEIRKKWMALKSDTKKKAASNKKEAKKSGGARPSPPLETLEEKIIGVVGNVVVDGIDGAIDTAELSREENKQFSIDEDDSSEEEEETLALANFKDRGLRGKSSNRKLEFSEMAPKKKKIASEEEAQNELIQIEKERLEIEKKLLHIDEMRLDVEKERLRVEKRKLEIKAEKMSSPLVIKRR